ncbi:hypothetical protein VKS41_001299 [Umbelopsis sp. WA50703]
MIMMKRHINLQTESVISQTSAFEKDKIFGRYILNSHCTQDSLLRLSCVCGSILNLGGGMINEFKVPDDSPSMFGLCLSVCVGTTTSMAEKILASCCILCFLIKCDNARNSIPSLKKGISSSWEDLLKTWERSSRSAPHYSLELELIFKLILLLMNGDDISDVFKTGLIPFEIHQSLICSANSRSDIPLSSFSMLEKCRLLILEPVSIFVNHNDVAGIH